MVGAAPRVTGKIRKLFTFDLIMAIGGGSAIAAAHWCVPLLDAANTQVRRSHPEPAEACVLRHRV